MTEEQWKEKTAPYAAELQSFLHAPATEYPAWLDVLAGSLGLNADGLRMIHEGRYEPGVEPPKELHPVTTPYGDMEVNAYVLADFTSKTALVCDTGADADGLLAFLERHDLTPLAILITHAHGDHIFELDRLSSKLKSPVYASKQEAADLGNGVQLLEEGEVLFPGQALETKVYLTPGHSPGGLSFFIPSKGVGLVGDVLFAGSMGGARQLLPVALHHLGRVIFCWPHDTVLAPGHGPLTSVGYEKRSNPFASLVPESNP